MKPKISIPHILLTLFCFAGLQIVLVIVLAAIELSADTRHSWMSSYVTFALIGFVVAGLTNTFSRATSILNIGIGAIMMAIVQAGLSFGHLNIQELHSSLEPITTSLSVSAMYLAGALLGARLSNRWHTFVSADNLAVNIVVVFLTIFGTAYINALFFSVLPNNIHALHYIGLLVYPALAGYVVQSCSTKQVDGPFVLTLFLLLTITSSWICVEEGFVVGMITALVCLIVVGLYFLLAKFGMVLARKQQESAVEVPNIPNATAVHKYNS